MTNEKNECCLECACEQLSGKCCCGSECKCEPTCECGEGCKCSE